MIIYIYGEDTYRSRKYLREVIEEFKKKRDPQGYNVAVLDFKRDEEKILGEFSAAPFLAEKRMVIIENILTSSDKDLLGELISKVKEKKIPETTVAVFWQGEKIGKVKEAGELQKLLAKEKYAKEFELLAGDELVKWVLREVKERGGKISGASAQYLAVNVHGDMWYLNSLLDQLVAYKKGEEIQLLDVQLFLEEKADDNIFNMAEAVARGDKKLAFKLLQEQRRLGAEESYLFSMILRQFRILLELRDLFEQEENLRSDEMASRLGLHPFVVKKSLMMVKQYPLARLKDIYRDLLAVDIKTKTGQGDQSLLIDLFVGKL